MSENDYRARSIPCPFCHDGEFLPFPKASSFFWHLAGHKYHVKFYLDALKCNNNNCSLIIYKGRSEEIE